MATGRRVIRHHPARSAPPRGVPRRRLTPTPAHQPSPAATPRPPHPSGRRRPALRTPGLWLLVSGGLLWALIRAPLLLPLTTRYGGNPRLFLLALLLIFVLGGLKQALWFRKLPLSGADD